MTYTVVLITNRCQVELIPKFVPCIRNRKMLESSTYVVKFDSKKAPTKVTLVKCQHIPDFL